MMYAITFHENTGFENIAFVLDGRIERTCSSNWERVRLLDDVTRNWSFGSIAERPKHANQISFIPVLVVVCKYSNTVDRTMEIICLNHYFSFNGVDDITSRAPVSCFRTLNDIFHVWFLSNLAKSLAFQSLRAW